MHAPPQAPQRRRRWLSAAASSGDGDGPQHERDQSEKQPPNQQEANKSSSSSSSSSGGGGGDGDDEPSGPRLALPPRVWRLLALLTQYGGVYGTAAVVIGWLTHVDPWGGLHWDAADVAFGLQLYAPLLLLDAALMLPDHSLPPGESLDAAAMLVGDASALGLSSPTTGAPRSGGGSSSSEGAAAAEDAGGLLLRLRLGLDLLQQLYTRANPTAGMNPAAEALVAVVASLADEMLYRSVGLTLLGLWMRCVMSACYVCPSSDCLDARQYAFATTAATAAC
jgi:hypothetical protein